MKSPVLIASTLGIAILSALTANLADASSHREAPNITRQPAVDSTDFYMFRSYEYDRADYVTMIANYIPFQDPQGGPNYFAMDSNAVYEIHIDNDGDAVEDLTFQFKFDNKLVKNGKGLKLKIGDEKVAVALKHTGFISTADDSSLGFKESYNLSMISGDRREGERQTITNLDGGESSFTKPYDNVGNKTFNDYAAYANQYIYDINIPGCAKPGKVFVGQRKESFVINIGEIFDLVNFVPIDESAGLAASIKQDPANDDLRNKNITSIALELPISCVTAQSSIIGAWTSASLPQARILNPSANFSKPEVNGGALTQVSRMGSPLVNELVIGLKDKDTFSASEPKDDGQFAAYVSNPTLPAILNELFLDAVNDLVGGGIKDLAPTNFPRNDLVAAFLTGVNGVNANGSVAEMIRLDTKVEPTEVGDQNSLGLVTGDMAGFPNGRRPVDDVVDIALRVVMGVLCYPVNIDLDGIDGPGSNGDVLGLCDAADASVGNVPFTDGAPISDADFDNVFPYLKTPLAGSPNN